MVDNNPTIGTVIGKAVGTKDDDGHGIVEVVVGECNGYSNYKHWNKC